MTLLHEILAQTAKRHPSRVALRFRERSVPYDAVFERTRALAAAFSAAGVGRGDRVVVYLQNRPEVVEVAFACSRLGAIFVPVNSMLRGRQLAHVLRDCGARVIVSSGSALSAAGEQAITPHLRLVVVCDGAGSFRWAGETVGYEDLIKGAHRPRNPAAGAIDKDPAAILYTSGSTGRPKGVVISHRNLVSGAYSVAEYLGNVPEDRLLVALPLSFDYGFSQVSTAFLTGACAVLTHFSMAGALVQEINAEAITGLAGVPTMWAHFVAGEWREGTGDSLRYITNSGGALAPEILRKLQARLPRARIFCMYGLTEAFRSTYLDPAELPERMGSIGKAIPNQEVMVLRSDGSRCNPGEPGELVHRGSLVALGYWNDPELTKQRFRPYSTGNAGLVDETVVWSGDLVRADEDGFLYFLGRTDQLLKTSGYRVSPSEIEEVALEIAGVIEAVAVGLPDEALGHRIGLALVVGDGTSPDIADVARQHLRQQLPSYMVPAMIHIVESIPRNPNGKQDRRALIMELQALTNPEPAPLATRSCR